MLPDSLARARALLENVTPLHADCGLSCGHACCCSLEGELSGMLLFPGEDAYYADLPDYRTVDTADGPLLICPGRCERGDRPLSCRLMPLIPLVRADGIKVATDHRAKTVCPLARQGKDALSAEFVDAVRQVGRILAEDETQRAFLEKLTAQQDELKALRNQFRRGSHV